MKVLTKTQMESLMEEYPNGGIVFACADDNICEKLRDNECDDCDGCTDENFHFTLYKWENGIGFGFHHQIGDVIISKTSENLYFKYCPWCGEKLTKDNIPFNKCCVGKLTRIER